MQNRALLLARRIVAPVLLALTAVAGPAAGQKVKVIHNMKWAKGKPDTVLSGINVCSTPMWKVFRMLGNPARTERITNQPVFVWERGEVKLKVSEYTFLRGLVPNFVEVSGKAPVGDIGKTGRGLALGATLNDIRRVYGRRFPVDVDESHRVSWVSVLWKGQGTAGLDFRLNSKGQVDYIQLLAGDCNPP